MYREIFKTYYPLLLSKLFIVSEIFICAVAVARFENADLNQAALSGLILPLGFLYESCIYDLITASTALSKNLNDLKVLKKYFFYLAIFTSVIGLLLFVSPLADFIIYNVFNSSQTIAALAKPALPLIIIWPWAVGYRRLLQGVLIRSARSDLVGFFSCLRVLVLIIALFLAYKVNVFPGAYSATLALTISVSIEALLVHLVFERMQRKKQIYEIDSSPLDLYQVNKFYLPLILSSFVHHLSLSMAAWAMFNMRDSLISLSVWGAISGIVWLLATFGHSYVDVVVFYTQKKINRQHLYNFSYGIAALTMFMVLTILYVPLISNLVFVDILKLSTGQLIVAKNAMLLGALLPAMRSIVSVPQGILIAENVTAAVTKGVFINIVVLGLLLLCSTLLKLPILGIYCYLISVTFALLAQNYYFSSKLKTLKYS